MKSFAVAALASVAAAWGENLGKNLGRASIKGHGIGLGYAQSGVGVYDQGYAGYGYKGGYDSIGGGQSAMGLRATLKGGRGRSSDKLVKNFGDHEYGNDDMEYGNDDMELGNDDEEYGTNMGVELGGEHLASNRLLQVGGVGNNLNKRLLVDKQRADMDRGSDHEGHRGHIGYNRRFASQVGPEFGDRDGSAYGNTDTVDLTALNDDAGEPHHDDHDDREQPHDDEGRHRSVFEYNLENEPRVQGIRGFDLAGTQGFAQPGRHHERAVSGHGKGFGQMAGEGPAIDIQPRGPGNYGGNGGYGVRGYDSTGLGFEQHDVGIIRRANIDDRQLPQARGADLGGRGPVRGVGLNRVQSRGDLGGLTNRGVYGYGLGGIDRGLNGINGLGVRGYGGYGGYGVYGGYGGVGLGYGGYGGYGLGGYGGYGYGDNLGYGYGGYGGRGLGLGRRGIVGNRGLIGGRGLVGGRGYGYSDNLGYGYDDNLGYGYGQVSVQRLGKGKGKAKKQPVW